MAKAGDKGAMERLKAFEGKLMGWPRTRENDPYWFHLNELANRELALGGMSEKPGRNGG